MWPDLTDLIPDLMPDLIPTLVILAILISIFLSYYVRARRARARIAAQWDAQLKALDQQNEITQRQCAALERIASALESLKDSTTPR
jgi:hypothetical protein